MTKIPLVVRMLVKCNWKVDSENEISHINLPEDDPDVFADILAYIRQGEVGLRSTASVPTEEPMKSSDSAGNPKNEIEPAEKPENWIIQAVGPANKSKPAGQPAKIVTQQKRSRPAAANRY